MPHGRPHGVAGFSATLGGPRRRSAPQTQGVRDASQVEEAAKLLLPQSELELALTALEGPAATLAGKGVSRLGSAVASRAGRKAAEELENLLEASLGRLEGARTPEEIFSETLKLERDSERAVERAQSTQRAAKVTAEAGEEVAENTAASSFLDPALSRTVTEAFPGLFGTPEER